jgi:6-phosphogluconolactonase
MSDPIHKRSDFSSGADLAERLASDVADDLNAAIAARGQVAIAVSGGSTPKEFFACLSKKDVDWHKVIITLVDERWVPATSDRSNEKLVRDFLMTGAASNATFVGLYCNANSPDDGLDQISASLPGHIDVAILGMGPDGHTASFFPGGDNLGAATDSGNPASVISMQAGGAGEPRITLTLSKLLSAGHLYLHIEGLEKNAVLNAALEDGPLNDAPVRAVLHQTEVPLHIYWAP